MKPPTAARISNSTTRHGREVQDEYAWMRDRSDPKVMAYLRAENEYADGVMRRSRPLQDRLYAEILGRIRETDRSVPVRVDSYEYYRRTVEGQPYAIHCRVPVGSDVEELLLDENELARGREYFRLGALAVSPDHACLAYSVDVDGGEKYTLHFKDLKTGESLPDVIHETYDSVVWAADGHTVFYTTIDQAHRPYRLNRHVLGQDPSSDVVVHQEDDESFFLGAYKTKSRRYVMLQLESNVTSEVRFLDASRPLDEFRTIEPRRKGVEYTVEHRGDSFFILTNDEAIDFKLVRAPVATPGRERWTDYLPHREGVKLDGIELFERHLAVSRRKLGLTGILVVDLESEDRHEIDFPEPVYTVAPLSNPEFETRELRFVYSSLVTPDSVFDYDMQTRERRLRKQDVVVGGYDQGAYRSERIEATAPDGTLVPISLVYRGDLRRDGGQPLLLYGYGSYGASIDPEFSSARLSLLDRGMIYAIAHVRGGGELGRSWYEAGKLRHKRNSFTDFIACAEKLIAERYTDSRKLAIRGGSAGGLLIGAVQNMRPDLFAVTLARVPFVDVVNTMLDPTIPLTVTEWEEWGNPQREEDYELMLSYSPYDNVAAVDYPHLLIMAGLNDPRVAYWEPAKWAARLRALKTDDNLLLLKTHMGAGHGGASGRYERIREMAYEFAFLLDRLGIEGS